jgi:Cryptococcal mannosyltransferase 1
VRPFHFNRWRAIQVLLAILIFINLTTFLPNRKATVNDCQNIPNTAMNLSSSSDSASPVGRVFVASLLKNSAEILRNGWSDAVVNLTRALGPENIWVSIHESGSWDGTKDELGTLDRRLTELGAGHDIGLGDLSQDMNTMIPKDGPGWITVDGEKMMRRIPWLAELRNINLGTLRDLAAKNLTFDKLLLLNDVVFTSDDALTLLRTRDGDYAAACGFDYDRPWPTTAFYDQFATRDIHGQELGSLYYPYFGSGQSRDAMMEGLVVPVKSCWSGIAAFDAAPLQDLDNPLRFRAISDSLAEHHVEASECCLVHYDNPLSASKGVWMNHNVRVGYNAARYAAVHQSGWPTAKEFILGHLSDLLIWFVPTQKRRIPIDRKYDEWRRLNANNTEIGSDCLVNKMMVVSDKGKWSEVRKPFLPS